MAKFKPPVSMNKAKKMMSEGMAHGMPMTKKQKGMFGAIAGGSYKGKSKKK